MQTLLPMELLHWKTDSCGRNVCQRRRYASRSGIASAGLFADKLKITLELNGQQREVTTNISGKLEAGKKYICNLKINLGGGGRITPESEGKYTKWFETPVITDSQLNDSMYITHNTDFEI